jgi:hypothetical protein
LAFVSVIQGSNKKRPERFTGLKWVIKSAKTAIKKGVDNHILYKISNFTHFFIAIYGAGVWQAVILIKN